MRISIAKPRKSDQINRGVDPLPVALQDALGFQTERDIVPDRTPWKQGRVLKHDHPRWMGAGDAVVVFTQNAGSRPFQSRDQPQQRGLAAAGGTQQRDEFAGFNNEAYIFQDREHGTVNVECMADVLDVERGTGGWISNGLGDDVGYHLTTPFCQTSK